jgi:hypothetical protein
LRALILSILLIHPIRAYDIFCDLARQYAIKYLPGRYTEGKSDQHMYCYLGLFKSI